MPHHPDLRTYSRATLAMTACALLLAAIAAGSPAQASALPKPAVAGSQTAASTIAGQAAQAAGSLSRFRVQMRALLADTLARYGARLSPAEREQMTALARRVDAELGGLERTAKGTVRLLRSGRNGPARDAARRAVLEYERAHAEATATLAQVQPILAPHLGLFEALEAKSLVDGQFRQFEGVGDQLRAVSAEVNRR